MQKIIKEIRNAEKIDFKRLESDEWVKDSMKKIREILKKEEDVVIKNETFLKEEIEEACPEDAEIKELFLELFALIKNNCEDQEDIRAILAFFLRHGFHHLDFLCYKLPIIPREWHDLWNRGNARSKTLKRYRELTNTELKKRIPAFCRILAELKEDPCWDNGGGCYWKQLKDRFYYFTDRLRAIVYILVIERVARMDYVPRDGLFNE